MSKPCQFNTHICKYGWRYIYYIYLCILQEFFVFVGCQKYLVSSHPLILLKKNLGQEFIFTVNQVSEQMGVSLELTFNLHPGPSFKHSFLDILSLPKGFAISLSLSTPPSCLASETRCFSILTKDFAKSCCFHFCSIFRIPPALSISKFLALHNCFILAARSPN